MERCYKIDVGKFDEPERKKFGVLLSRLFRAEWSKMMKNMSGIQDEVFLLKLLQWSPFLHFMNVFCKWNFTNDVYKSIKYIILLS